MDSNDAGGVEGRTGCSSVGILNLFSICELGVLVGGHDAFDGRFVSILGKNGGNVFIHYETASAFVVVPCKIDTGVMRAGPVLGGRVVVEEGIA